MRSVNISIVHIAFLFSLIFHAAILSMNISVDKPDAVPIKIFKIRYSPVVEEKKEMPIKEQAIAKREKPTPKIAVPAPEIPKHPERQVVKNDVYELPEEVAEKPITDAAVAVHAETIPAVPEIKEIRTEIDFTWIVELRNRIEAIKKYPDTAKRMGIEGTVVMIIEFDKKGELINVHIKSSSGHGILDRDAMSLIKRVSPLRHGAGKDIVIELPISYYLIKR